MLRANSAIVGSSVDGLKSPWMPAGLLWTLMRCGPTAWSRSTRSRATSPLKLRFANTRNLCCSLDASSALSRASETVRTTRRYIQ
jgi:hypothetical protein